MQAHPNVYDALRRALDVERRAHPDRPALRAAQSGWKRAQHEFEHAKAQMLRANLRLVVHVAKNYRGQGVPFLDLIQEGNIGLMRAADKFEPERGLKFVTSAHWWIRQAIRRAVIEQQGTIPMQARCNAVDVLSTNLGDDHDLSILRATLVEGPADFGGEEMIQA